MSSDFSNIPEVKLENRVQMEENGNLDVIMQEIAVPNGVIQDASSEKRKRTTDVIVLSGSSVEDDAPAAEQSARPVMVTNTFNPINTFNAINSPSIYENASSTGINDSRIPKINRPRNNTDIYIGVLSDDPRVAVFASKANLLVSSRVFYEDLPPSTTYMDFKIGTNGRISIQRVVLDRAVIADAVLTQGGVLRADLINGELKALRTTVSTYYDMVSGGVPPMANNGDGGDKEENPAKAHATPRAITTPRQHKKVTFDEDSDYSKQSTPPPKRQYIRKVPTMDRPRSEPSPANSGGKPASVRVGSLKSDPSSIVFVSLSTHTNRTPYVLYKTKAPNKGRWKWENVDFLPAYQMSGDLAAKEHFRSLLADAGNVEGDGSDSDSRPPTKKRKSGLSIATSLDASDVVSTPPARGEAPTRQATDDSNDAEPPVLYHSGKMPQVARSNSNMDIDSSPPIRKGSEPRQDVLPSPLAQLNQRPQRKVKPRISLAEIDASESESNIEVDPIPTGHAVPGIPTKPRLATSTLPRPRPRSHPQKQPAVRSVVDMAQDYTEDTQAQIKRLQEELAAANLQIATLSAQLASCTIAPHLTSQSTFTPPPTTVTVDGLTYHRDPTSTLPGLLTHHSSERESWGGKKWTRISTLQDVDIIGDQEKYTPHHIGGNDYEMSTLADGREILVRRPFGMVQIDGLRYVGKIVMREVRDGDAVGGAVGGLV